MSENDRACGADEMEGLESLRAELENKLPAVFGRSVITDLLPGIISGKTLANLESKGEGPVGYWCGNRRFYERKTFVPWLLGRCRYRKGRK